MELMDHVNNVSAALKAFAAAFVHEPTAETFDENIDAIIALERALDLKATIDLAVAHAATLANAGSHAASTKAVDFFIHVMGLSRREAYARIRRGEQEYGEVADPAFNPTGVDAAPEEVQRRKEAEQTARNNARAEALANHLPAEKHNIIERELRQLKPGTTLTYHGLREKAVHEATLRTPEDLRTWLRTQIKNTNRRLVPNQVRAMAQRTLVIGTPDVDGGCHFHGYAPSEMLALLEAAIIPRSKVGALASVPAAKDKRTPGQRRLDALWHVLRTFNQNMVSNNAGLASIVISMSAKDFADDNFTSCPTNTRAHLSPLDIIRLGAARYDYAVVLDPHNGNPLKLQRTSRLANFEQKIALQASQQVCIHPGCEQPVIYCDAHHLVSWAQGGYTDIENLTLLCKHHHTSNDDTRSLTNRGYADRCTDTGRVGFSSPPGRHRPGGIALNNTIAQEESGGATTRNQAWPERQGHGPPETSTTHTPTSRQNSR